MDCTFIQNNLFAIAENHLTEAEMSGVKEHLSACANCAASVASFASLFELIERDRKAEFNPFLSTRILQKMENRSVRPGRGVLLLMPGALRPLLAAVLIILAVFTGFLAGKQGKHLSEAPAYRNDLKTMKSDLFISELNDEDKTVELYK